MATSDLETLANGLGLSEEQVAQLRTNIATLKTEKLLELDSDVARAKEGMHITKAGLNVLAKAIAGANLHYTRVAFGDSIKNGVLVEPTATQILNYTSLINERTMSLPMSDVRFGGNGTVVVTFQVNNADLETGFWARELGIFVRDPANANKEILYAYKNWGALSTYIPGGGGAVALNLAMSCVTIVDQATNVTAVVDADLLYVSQAELLDHVNSNEPHPNIPKLKQEVTTSSYFWATGSDTQLRPISATNLQTQILGDKIESLSLMQSRISQTEINIANLFAQLDAEKEVGLEANLLLVEDFIDCDTVDQTKVKVEDQVAGGYQVCVESHEGLLEGFYYTISDGSHSQNVRIKFLARNDENLVVIFEEGLQYTFNLNKCYLYRSSGNFNVKSASTSGDIRSTIIRFPDVWKGEAASTTTATTLKTIESNRANFELIGDCAFTANGEFTIG